MCYYVSGPAGTFYIKRFLIYKKSIGGIYARIIHLRPIRVIFFKFILLSCLLLSGEGLCMKENDWEIHRVGHCDWKNFC